MGLPLTVSEANSQERAILLSITDKPVWQCWNSLWHFCWTVHALVCGRVHTIHDLWHHDLQLPWPCPWSQVQAWNYPTLSTVFWRMENKLDHKNERNTTTSLVTPQSNLMCIYFLSSNFSIMFLLGFINPQCLHSQQNFFITYFISPPFSDFSNLLALYFSKIFFLASHFCIFYSHPHFSYFFLTSFILIFFSAPLALIFCFLSLLHAHTHFSKHSTFL